ncbi:transcriptional regulator [Campylobacter estrildidarum]|uniref:Transcriptional regulator n=1 Tax=Campylobacter estrildidarum TaxID=2510189 RepID=A0A4U7BLS8_9BACT|nr:transcriptional regulator [Campylobacter estrildidarum]
MLKEYRFYKNWTQEDLANYSGVSLPTIKRYEAGNDNATTTNLKKIADALEVDVSNFLSPNLSPKSKKNVSQSTNLNKNLSPNQTKLKKPQEESFYYIPKLNINASAGGGNEVEGLEHYESGELMAIDKAFFKTIPSTNIKAIRVDGYSMTPMLFPDSWVIFEEGSDFKGDGLYVLNYNGQLMVKLLQLNPFENILEIISVNKEYKSYSVKLDESQISVLIKGKVLRSVI